MEKCAKSQVDFEICSRWNYLLIIGSSLHSVCSLTSEDDQRLPVFSLLFIASCFTSMKSIESSMSLVQRSHGKLLKPQNVFWILQMCTTHDRVHSFDLRFFVGTSTYLDGEKIKANKVKVRLSVTNPKNVKLAFWTAAVLHLRVIGRSRSKSNPEYQVQARRQWYHF